jgi:hypothetical protein
VSLGEGGVIFRRDRPALAFEGPRRRELDRGQRLRVCAACRGHGIGDSGDEVGIVGDHMANGVGPDASGCAVAHPQPRQEGHVVPRRLAKPAVPETQRGAPVVAGLDDELRGEAVAQQEVRARRPGFGRGEQCDGRQGGARILR